MTAYGNAANTGNAFTFNKFYNGGVTPLMTMQKNGKVLIGDPNQVTTPGNYLLYVQTGIMAERVRVALKNSTDWADYVFQKGYPLMSLPEISSYIQEHKHLPGMPSAEQVVKEGIDVAEMNARLLQKIEELTLYVIKQQQEIELLKNDRNTKKGHL